MSSTIESTNNNILTKIKALKKLADLFEENRIPLDNRLKCQILTLEEEYELGSINILSDYFLAVRLYKLNKNSDEDEKRKFDTKKEKCFNLYQSFIRKENFTSRMDRIFKKTKIHINSRGIDLSMNSKKVSPTQVKFESDIFELIKLYENSSVNKNIKEISYESCEKCGSKMTVIPNNSELICENCGITKNLYGTVFEDDQFYYQEGQRTRHGNYDPTKHCRIWVERIQARETTDIPHKVIERIKKCIARDRVRDIKRINCAQIRKYLRQTHNSKYNEHIPLIRKLINGVVPPQLTDHELQLINIYFDKVIRIFDEVKPTSKTNCPYHPFFIYKIIEQIMKDPADKTRKKRILSCIHLQSRETLVQNDLIWRPICQRIEEFIYIPTDRNTQQIDY